MNSLSYDAWLSYASHHSATGLYCPSEQETSASILWPLTPEGETVFQPCPCMESRSNNASRTCGGNGMWLPSDLSLCILTANVLSLCSAVSYKGQFPLQPI